MVKGYNRGNGVFRSYRMRVYVPLIFQRILQAYTAPDTDKADPNSDSVRTGHGTTGWFQIGKEYVKAIYCHPAYLTYMQST